MPWSCLPKTCLRHHPPVLTIEISDLLAGQRSADLEGVDSETGWSSSEEEIGPTTTGPLGHRAGRFAPARCRERPGSLMFTRSVDTSRSNDLTWK